MTHNGRQFVPLLQRLAVRAELCVSGFRQHERDTGAVMETTTAERQRLKSWNVKIVELRRSNVSFAQGFRLFCEAGFDRLWKK